MSLPKFEQRNTYASGTGYICTNEQPEVYRDIFLKDRSFTRAGGIASGGEVILGAILPKSEEVLAVDHSCNALCAFYLKALILGFIGGY